LKEWVHSILTLNLVGIIGLSGMILYALVPLMAAYLWYAMNQAFGGIIKAMFWSS
jgi:hypothetical protein